MSIQLLRKYNKPGPRYTSYPPATFFHPEFSKDDYIKHISNSNKEESQNISLYVHIPFCPRLCHFCGCNTSAYKSQDFVKRYIQAIKTEIQSVSKYIDKNRKVTQIHWGGGTPNSISLDLVEEVMNEFSGIYNYSNDAEIAMECNPAYLEFKDIDRLYEMGFNRLSLGIQDFNEYILNNVNRAPSKHPVEELVKHMRKNGFAGVNIDLIYGLPGQNADNFKESIDKVIEISPDRLVTFSYAHVPWVKNAQKHLEKIGLPSPEEKLDMFDMAYKKLLERGYISIGMDHYAKPDDELAIALKNNKLHRNFQGYCTKKTTGQVYGFGATSISQLWGAYSQNYKEINKYIESIEKTGFAVERGYELSKEDQVRREVINEIMCNGHLNFNEIAKTFHITIEELKNIVGYNEANLKEFEEDSLLTIENDIIRLNSQGFFVVRNIAMKFDPLLENKKAQYSKTI
ncbi:oxygen-independent coproporphyrinogen III oxidase [Bacteroidota bacterium]